MGQNLLLLGQLHLWTTSEPRSSPAAPFSKGLSVLSPQEAWVHVHPPSQMPHPTWLTLPGASTAPPPESSLIRTPLSCDRRPRSECALQNSCTCVLLSPGCECAEGCICLRLFVSFTSSYRLEMGLPKWTSGKEPASQCRRLRRHGFDPWVGMIPWIRKWQPIPAFLPWKFCGQRC